MTKSILTKRQRQVLTMRANGMSNKEIAHQDEVRPDTVAAILSRIYRKLGVNDSCQAMAVAVILGIVPAYKIQIPPGLREDESA